MACCEPELDKQAPVAYRNALIAVLAINLVMFGVEAAVGLFSGSGHCAPTRWISWVTPLPTASPFGRWGNP